MTWPIIFDGGMIGGPIATQWDIRRWPTPYLIDDQGIIRCWSSMQNVLLMVDELVARASERAQRGR